MIFPVVLSGRFDDGGLLAGLRIVSDPRDTSRDRDEAYLLRNFLTARFGRDGWDCVDTPPVEGETPVGRTLVKQHCRKTVDGTMTADIETHYFRKKGESQYDPHLRQNDRRPVRKHGLVRADAGRNKSPGRSAPRQGSSPRTRGIHNPCGCKIVRAVVIGPRFRGRDAVA